MSLSAVWRAICFLMKPESLSERQKMKAWLDLTDKKSQGLLVKERDLRKHRQDVFRLFPLISNDAEISVPEEVFDDIQKFIKELRSMPFETRQIGMDIDKNEILDVYGRIYVKK